MKYPSIASCELIVRAIIVRDGQLLVNSGTHPDTGQRYYALPGGHVERGESCGEALRRELQEEMDLVCEVGSLGFVVEQMYPGRHAEDNLRHELVLYFEATVPTEISLVSSEVEKDFRWVPLEQLATAPFLPPITASSLQKYFSEGTSSYVFQDNITTDKN